MSNNREVIFVKVDVDKALREKKTLPKSQFGKEVSYSRSHLQSKQWRMEMGKKGLMNKEDYEAGLFAAYGLSAERVTGQTEAKVLTEANNDLQKQIAELQAQLAAKETTKKVKEDKPNKE